MRRIALSILAVIVAVSFQYTCNAENRQDFPRADDYSKAQQFLYLMENIEVIVTGKSFTSETSIDTDGNTITSCTCIPFRGIELTINYKNQDLLSYVVSADAKNKYAEDKLSNVLIAFYMTFADCDASEAGNIVEYLVTNYDSDPILGKISELQQKEFLTKMIINEVTKFALFSIYPELE